MIGLLIRREIRIATRLGGGGELGLIFFLLLVTVVPFAVGPDQATLRRLAPAILWIAALLATLIGLDRLFRAEEEEGALDALLLAATPLEVTVFAKAFAHWLTTGFVLSLAAPIFGLMLAIEPGTMLPVTLTLLIGTPALTLIGAVGAALTVSLRRGGLLIPVLVLPFAIPTLIFGVSAAKADAEGFVPLALLGALTLLMTVLGPFAAAAALRHARE